MGWDQPRAVRHRLQVWLCRHLIPGAHPLVLSNVVLLSPILAPLATALGVDPIHFAMILLVNLNIGMNTPPMGGLLLITRSMTGEKFDSVMHEIWPFIGTQIITLLFITYWPATTLWLPNLFGFH